MSPSVNLNTNENKGSIDSKICRKMIELLLYLAFNTPNAGDALGLLGGDASI